MKIRFLAAALLALTASSVSRGQQLPATLSDDTSKIPAITFTDTPQQSYRMWGSADYLLWWVKSDRLATPLVTTTNTPFLFDAAGNNVSAGLGRQGTSILFGGNDISYNPFSGGKFIVGTWIDADQKFGVEGRGFFLSQNSINRTFASQPNGLPVVGIPVYNPFPINTPLLGVSVGENAVVESFPLSRIAGTAFFSGGFVGSDTVVTHSQLWGAQMNGVVNLARADRWSFDGIVGFRYADLMEDISLIGTSTSTVPVNSFGGVAFLNNFYNGVVTSYDSWHTRNQFYGGQLGFKAETQFRRASFRLLAQVALGDTNQHLDIRGLSTLATFTGVTAQTIGGTLATVNNIGSYSRNQFSVIPEVQFQVGYNFTPRLRGFIGYDFLYWSNVARPGDQVNRVVDLRQVPTLPIYNAALHNTLPAPQIHNSDFWASGVTFGFQFRY